MLRCISLLVTCVVAVAAQDLKWKDVRPAGQEFAVEMPGLPTRVTHIITSDQGKDLSPNVYDLVVDKVRYQIISFGAGGPRSIAQEFDGFAEGFQRAFIAADNRRNTIKFEKNLQVKQQSVPQFRVTVGDHIGVVRLYHAEHYFYAVMVIGGDESDSVINRFLTSFQVRELNMQLPDKALASFLQPEEPPEPWSGPAPASTSPVDVGMLNGKTIKFPGPKYPDAGRASRASGMVVVRVVVDEDGKVISADAVAGPPSLQEAATKAAWKAQFVPTLQLGKRIKVTGVLQYAFVYQGP